MKSGYSQYTNIWGNSYYDDQFEEIESKETFENKIFHSLPALKSNYSIAGYFKLVPYNGGEYDRSKFKLIEKGWNHEHCWVCQFGIDDDYSFWENKDGKILCDACYEHYIVKRKEEKS